MLSLDSTVKPKCDQAPQRRITAAEKAGLYSRPSKCLSIADLKTLYGDPVIRSHSAPRTLESPFASTDPLDGRGPVGSGSGTESSGGSATYSSSSSPRRAPQEVTRKLSAEAYSPEASRKLSGSPPPWRILEEVEGGSRGTQCPHLDVPRENARLSTSRFLHRPLNSSPSAPTRMGAEAKRLPLGPTDPGDHQSFTRSISPAPGGTNEADRCIALAGRHEEGTQRARDGPGAGCRQVGSPGTPSRPGRSGVSGTVSQSLAGLRLSSRPDKKGRNGTPVRRRSIELQGRARNPTANLVGSSSRSGRSSLFDDLSVALSSEPISGKPSTSHPPLTASQSNDNRCRGVSSSTGPALPSAGLSSTALEEVSQAPQEEPPSPVRMFFVDAPILSGARRTEEDSPDPRACQKVPERPQGAEGCGGLDLDRNHVEQMASSRRRTHGKGGIPRDPSDPRTKQGKRDKGLSPLTHPRFTHGAFAKSASLPVQSQSAALSSLAREALAKAGSMAEAKHPLSRTYPEVSGVHSSASPVKGKGPWPALPRLYLPRSGSFPGQPPEVQKLPPKSILITSSDGLRRVCSLERRVSFKDEAELILYK